MQKQLEKILDIGVVNEALFRSCYKLATMLLPTLELVRTLRFNKPSDLNDFILSCLHSIIVKNDFQWNQLQETYHSCVNTLNFLLISKDHSLQGMYENEKKEVNMNSVID